MRSLEKIKMASTRASGINNERRPPVRLRGVRQRHWGSWVSEIRHPISKRRVWLGTFATQDEAARVYDAAAWIINGPKAKTNYPYCPLAFSNAFTVLPPSLRRKLHRCCLESLKLSPSNLRQPESAPSPSPSKSPSNIAGNRPLTNQTPDPISLPIHTIESSIESSITFDYNPNPNPNRCCSDYQSLESAPIYAHQEKFDHFQQSISPKSQPIHITESSPESNSNPNCGCPDYQSPEPAPIYAHLGKFDHFQQPISRLSQPIHIIESSFDCNPNPNCGFRDYQSQESAPSREDPENYEHCQQPNWPYYNPAQLNAAADASNPLPYDTVRNSAEPAAAVYDTACTLIADIDPQNSAATGDGDRRCCDMHQIMYCNEALMELYHNYEHVLFGDSAAAAADYGNGQNSYGNDNYSLIDDEILSLMMSSEYKFGLIS